MQAITNIVFKYSALCGFFLVSFLISACDYQHSSHTAPYIAKKQPLFYMDGEIQKISTDDTYIHRLVLIGDAGMADIEPAKSHLTAIAKRLNTLETSETLVFLGDNIYDIGFQEKVVDCASQKQDSQRLMEQLKIGIDSSNISYFVGGNHDWDYREKPNKEIIMLNQKKFIEECGKRAHLVPSEGEQLKLVSAIKNNLFTLIFLDTEQIIQADETRKSEAINEIAALVENTAVHIPVFIAGHHPIATFGPHGGCYQENYFGHSIINFFRRNGISWGQDTNDKNYADYIKRVTEIIPRAHKVIFVAGHDHNLQVISLNEKGRDKGPDYSLVSGSGSKRDRVCHGDNTLFAQESLGYMELGFRQSGILTVDIFAYNAESDNFKQVYSQRLF